jgi:hypothetical protein
VYNNISGLLPPNSFCIKKKIGCSSLSIIFHHLQELFRKIAVVASFLRRQASLLINVYLNEDGALLPTQKLQSFFEYAQGFISS